MSDAERRHSDQERFPQLAFDQLDLSQRVLAERILSVSSIGLGGPYNTLLRSPVLGERMFDLLYYLRWQTSLPAKLNEFAILIVGRKWHSQVEWFAHQPLALKAGVSLAVINELKSGKRPGTMSAQEDAVYDFLNELLNNQQVGSLTFSRIRKYFNDQQIVDLTTIAGTYATIAMLLAMSEQGLPPGAVRPLE